MSTTPDFERDAEPQASPAAPDPAVEGDGDRGQAAVSEVASEPATVAPRRAAPKSAAALIFDDPLNQQSSDDTDRGWGERPAGGDSASDLARFLAEKPPHHL